MKWLIVVSAVLLVGCQKYSNERHFPVVMEWIENNIDDPRDLEILAWENKQSKFWENKPVVLVRFRCGEPPEIHLCALVIDDMGRVDRVSDVPRDNMFSHEIEALDKEIAATKAEYDALRE